MARKTQQAFRGNGGGHPPKPAWVWLLAGVLLGLAVSAFALYQDWVPALRKADVPQPNPAAQAPTDGESGVPEPARIETKPKYDFYSVLPEMEVVIPEAEVTAEAARTPSPAAPGMRYLLQTGSFRAAGDADAMKARLALLGLRAQVVPVNINDARWHRVRLGPYASARELDDARRELEANGIEAIALKEAAPP